MRTQGVSPLPENNLPNIDAKFMENMWQAVDHAMEDFKRSSFSKEKKAEFTPLSLSDSIATSPLLGKGQISLESCSHLLDGLGQNYQYQKDLTNEEHFSLLDIGMSGEQFVASFRVCDYVRTGAESYCAVDIVVYVDLDGAIRAVPIVKKAIVAGEMGGEGALGRATLARTKKLEELANDGVPVAHIHGVDAKSAVIYEKLYCGNADATYESMKLDHELAAIYLPQLVIIAKILDEAGYSSIGFLRDLIFDGDQFLFIDGGSDVGNKGETAKDAKKSYGALIRKFPQYSSEIDSLYYGPTDDLVGDTALLTKVQVSESTGL